MFGNALVGEMISSIEILFQLPVELTDEECQSLGRFVGRICDRHKPTGWCYWPSGHGYRPIWREPEEPLWDDSVYQISTCAREAWPEEIERDRIREEKKSARKATLKYRALTKLHHAVDAVHEWLYWMEGK